MQRLALMLVIEELKIILGLYNLSGCSLPYVVFNWVRWDANLLTYTLVKGQSLIKFAFRNNCFSFCNFDSLPPLVKEAGCYL